MTDKEIVTTTIDRFVSLLRIDRAKDRDTEIKNQYATLKTQLENMGVSVTELEASIN